MTEEDSHIVAAAQEERFTRKKFDARVPTNAIRYDLGECGMSPDVFMRTASTSVMAMKREHAKHVVACIEEPGMRCP